MNRSELERQIEVIEQTMADVQKDLIRRSVGLKAKRCDLRRKLR